MYIFAFIFLLGVTGSIDASNSAVTSAERPEIESAGHALIEQAKAELGANPDALILHQAEVLAEIKERKRQPARLIADNLEEQQAKVKLMELIQQRDQARNLEQLAREVELLKNVIMETSTGMSGN